MLLFFVADKPVLYVIASDTTKTGFHVTRLIYLPVEPGKHSFDHHVHCKVSAQPKIEQETYKRIIITTCHRNKHF